MLLGYKIAPCIHLKHNATDAVLLPNQPETDLGRQGMRSPRAKDINQTITRYLAENLFQEVEDSLICVERRLRNGKMRCSIVGAKMARSIKQ